MREIDMKVSEGEKRLLEQLRETEWGEVTIKLREGDPIFVTEVRRDIKLTAD